MSADFWSSEDFERRVTAATIALYETQIDKESPGSAASTHRFRKEELNRVRREGIFIPGPDRWIVMGGISTLTWPPSGCVSLGAHYKSGVANEPADLIESYCRLVYFRRLKTLPSHSAMIRVGDIYETIHSWPQDKGPLIGFTDHLTVNRRTGQVSPTMPAWDKGNPSKVAAVLSDPELFKRTEALSFAIQLIDDARHQWAITAHNEVSKVTVGAHAESVKSLLYARDLPVTATGRKRPILHIVSAHNRRIKNGTDIDVRQFLRGTREIVMNDTKYSVSAPQALIEEMASAT